MIITVMMKNIKRIFYSNFKTKIGALLIKKDMYSFKKKMDYNEYGGAPLMGISKPVFKSHGSSNANTFRNALRNTYLFVQKDVVGKISDSLASMKLEEDGQDSRE